MESLVELIYRLKASCVASDLDIMSESGLSPAEYNGIAAMEPQDSISGNAVSRKMNLSASRASRVIDKMVQNGYLEREIDCNDRRKCNITLAEKGVKIKKRIKKVRQTCEKQIRENLSDQEIKNFSGTLKKIIEIMG
jgi:DNA-binding MarR family transcriptional regulator